jgi:energy-coupling factor transporter ATP-binding protein EcfA2
LGDVTMKRLDCCTEDIPAFERPYVITPRVAKVLYQLMKAAENKEHVLLVGEKGCGKSSIIEYFAHLRNQSHYYQVFEPQSDPSMMVGQYGPTGWRDAFLSKALKQRGVALADELNAAPPPVTERPNALLDGEKNFYVTEKAGNAVIPVPKEFFFAAAVNPATYSGRFRFSRALMNRLTVINVPQLDVTELKTMAAILGGKQQLPKAFTDAMVDMQEWVNEGVRNKTLASDDTQAKEHAMRTIEKALQYVKKFVPMRMVQAHANVADARATRALVVPPSLAQVQRSVFVDAADFCYRMTGRERQLVRDKARQLVTGGGQ